MTRSEAHPEELAHGCSFCGAREWYAFWRTEKGVVRVCAGCAATVLPWFIADAAHEARRDEQWTANDVLREYWRARALAAERTVRRCELRELEEDL